MTKLNEMDMFNPVASVIAIIVIFSLLFVAVELKKDSLKDDIKNFENSFITYEKQQSDINRNALIKSVKKALSYDTGYQEYLALDSALDKSLSVLIKKKDWLLVNDLYSLSVKVDGSHPSSPRNGFHSIGFSRNTLNLINAYYTDSDYNREFDKVNTAKAVSIISYGSRELEQGNLNKAYNLFAKAGITDTTDKAKYAKGLAVHYGCSNLAEVWGGLTSKNETFTGSNLEASKMTLTNSEITEARLNLKKRILPTIDESCPIAQF